MRHRFPRFRLLAAAAVAPLLLAGGCVHQAPRVYGSPGVSTRPDRPWTPPAGLAQATPEAAAPDIPEALKKAGEDLTLLDIVDVALRSSPQTAEAWAQARSAAAAYGSEKGAYYPQLDATANVARAQGTIANGRIAFFQRSYGPGADLSWLLFDFGGRGAAVDETRQALVAADFTHNAVIQGVILDVEKAYFTYVATKALLEAQEATLKEARANLDAAEERHKAGLATIADVLQAKTSMAQAQLALDGLQGQVETTRGALATAMGLPANTPYDVGVPKVEMPVDRTFEAVEGYLAKAQRLRPDLAAARAEAEKAGSHLKKVKAEGYPSLTGAAAVGRTYFDSRNLYGNTYSAGIYLKVPLFTGFSHQYNVMKAAADEDAARARLKGLEQRVVFEVWSSYHDLKTSRQRVLTSEDLFRSASESHDVALGRYKAGVGSILDLLAAQGQLADARAQRVQAYADWYASLAQLAHDTGTLSVDDPVKELVAPVAVEEKKP